MNKKTLKSIVYTLGKTIGIFALAYVFYQLSKEYTIESFFDQFSLILPLIPMLFIFNILSIIIGILAWHSILRKYATVDFSFITSYYYFTKTEIAKYLPGNIFHFVGRQVFASNIGINQIQMAKISLVFSLFLLGSTVITSTFFLIFSQKISSNILYLMILASLITIVIIVLSYKSLSLHKKIRINLLLMLSIAFQGVMLSFIILYQQNLFDLGLFFQYAGIYVLSWLIGFATPGASGGIGIREGAFISIVTFLNLTISSEIILFSILLIRLVNILVDALLFLSTFLIKSKIKSILP